MKKSIFIIATLLVVVVSLVGCNSNTLPVEENENNRISTIKEMVLEESDTTQNFRSTTGIEFEVSENHYCWVESDRVLYTVTDEFLERQFEDNFKESEWDFTISSTNEILYIQYYTLKRDAETDIVESVLFAVEEVGNNSIVVPTRLEIPNEYTETTHVDEFVVYVKGEAGATYSLPFVLSGK